MNHVVDNDDYFIICPHIIHYKIRKGSSLSMVIISFRDIVEAMLGLG